jgi:hypothetical protein
MLGVLFSDIFFGNYFDIQIIQPVKKSLRWDHHLGGRFQTFASLSVGSMVLCDPGGEKQLLWEQNLHLHRLVDGAILS